MIKMRTQTQTQTQTMMIKTLISCEQKLTAKMLVNAGNEKKYKFDFMQRLGVERNASKSGLTSSEHATASHSLNMTA